MLYIRHRKCEDVVMFEVKAATLEGANLAGAFLLGSQLSGMRCGRINLRGATLKDADLTGADFVGADLTGANLSRATLRHANFRSADLTHANLAGAILEGTLYDERTRWPAGLRPEEHGARRAVDCYRVDAGYALRKPPAASECVTLVLTEGACLGADDAGEAVVRREGWDTGRSIRTALDSGWCWVWEESPAGPAGVGSKGAHFALAQPVLCMECQHHVEAGTAVCPYCLQRLWNDARVACYRAGVLMRQSQSLVLACSSARDMRARARAADRRLEASPPNNLPPAH
jgi:hypothetical protein